MKQWYILSSESPGGLRDENGVPVEWTLAFRLQNGIGPREYRSCMARSSCLASNTQKSGR